MSTCNLRIWEVEREGSGIQAEPGFHEIPLQASKKVKSYVPLLTPSTSSPVFPRPCLLTGSPDRALFSSLSTVPPHLWQCLACVIGTMKVSVSFRCSKYMLYTAVSPSLRCLSDFPTLDKGLSPDGGFMRPCWLLVYSPGFVSFRATRSFVLLIGLLRSVH